jgi:hypothetical protein
MVKQTRPVSNRTTRTGPEKLSYVWLGFLQPFVVVAFAGFLPGLENCMHLPTSNHARIYAG